MTEILTSAQMRAIEQAAIESGAVTGLDLMERAGQGVVDAIFAQWPDLAKGRRRATVLCGPGNNGGDGFVVARLLHEAGWEVFALALPVAGRRSADAEAALARLSATGCHCGAFLRGVGSAIYEDDQTDLVIDALFGIGLTRPLPDSVSECAEDLSMLQTLGEMHPGLPRAMVVAVDVPSGLDADTGDIPGYEARATAIRADLTVTFHARKQAHVAGRFADFCGKVVVVDIGLGPWDMRRHDV